jgi:hypothetical protein
MEKEIHSLGYYSSATRSMDRAALSALLLKAQRFNDSVGVTGLLIYAKGRFMQTLEGSDAAIAEAYARIERDPQHNDIGVFFNEVVTTRVYPTWAMMSSIETASATISTFLKERLEKPNTAITPGQREAVEKSFHFIETNGEILTPTRVQRVRQ